ncbi:cation transport protein-domain-containing protein [Xylogone sp. PMI_703]|nr:cation transport protein-domain-containing protein [Xylogone sp. PMI_703]
MAYPLFDEIWKQIVAMKPAFISKKPHFSFISVHYFYILGCVIIGSLCVFIRGGEIRYIDALFLASGASTQSGLNTVDINRLNTWQQLVLYCISGLCNPITINTFVVFLRLFWFEKRFQHIVQEARRTRRLGAQSFSKSKSQMKTDGPDLDAAERGVNGRSIVVMHNTTRPNGMTNGHATPGDFEDALKKFKNMTDSQGPTPQPSRPESQGSGQQRDSVSLGEEPIAPDLPHQTQITFAEQVKRSDGMRDGTLSSPIQRSKEDHIAFLERQRNPQDRGVLRIPGPRDADAGVAPETLDEVDILNRPVSRRDSIFSDDPEERRRLPQLSNRNSEDNTTQRRNITIEEPTRRESEDDLSDDARAALNTLDIFGLRRLIACIRHRKRPHLHRPDGDELHPIRSRVMSFQGLKRALSADKTTENMPYLSWEPTVGRNSTFVDLTEEQREELGGIEYRALKSLALILVIYFFGFSLFALLSLLPWILNSGRYGDVVKAAGQGRVWWAFFTANSAFTDTGFTLTPDSMISFNTAIWPLLVMSFLIIIGNTGFPIMLRVIIWVSSKVVRRDSGIWDELNFLLDHPRRCFTLLFPSGATWWLFWILVLLNGIDLIFFIILDLGNTIVTQLPVNIRLLDGWFQAVATRTAGFGVVNLAQLHPAIQTSYLIMMYISVLPIAISVRRTNVYEEQSLGIYGSQAEEDEDQGEPSYVGAHLRRQLSFDLWYIFLGFFVISISEGKRLQNNDPAFSMFAVLFEIVSAYGTVGLSLGYPTINASFSAEFGVIAKLVIIAMQIRGRHRGLPYELDRAILLPSEHLQKKEVEDDIMRVRRRASAATMGTTGTSTGVQPTRSQTTMTARKRSKSRDHRAQNFLGVLLHPGPTIPNSHRGTDTPPLRQRRYSTSDAPESAERSGRSMSPKRRDFAIPLEESNTTVTSQASGRRTFHQEGLNNQS